MIFLKKWLQKLFWQTRSDSLREFQTSILLDFQNLLKCETQCADVPQIAENRLNLVLTAQKASEMAKGSDPSKEIETFDAFESASLPVAADEEGIVRNVKLLGLRSKNRRNYDTPGVRKTAKNLLEGALVYIDHPATPTTPRSYRDKFGVVENVQYRDGLGHVGDVRYNPNHVCAKQFAWDVKHSPKSLGMSINARYTPGKIGKDGFENVDSLDEIRSVDVVTRPATASGIFEHETEEEDDMALDLKTLKEKHGDIVEQLLAEHKADATESSEIEKLKREAQEAREALAKLKADAELHALQASVTESFTKIFGEKEVPADVIKDLVECACQMKEDGRKKMVEAIGKLGPMLVVVPDDEDAEDEPVKFGKESEDEDVTEDEDDDKKSTYRPGNKKQKSGKGGYNLLSSLGLK